MSPGAVSGPAALIALVALACCGGATTGASGAPGSSSVHGSIMGQTIAVMDAFSATETESLGPEPVYLAVVEMGSLAGLCSAAARHANPPNLQIVAIAVASSSSVTTGTFPIDPSGNLGNGPSAQMVYESQGPACQTITQQDALSGTVTLTSIGASGITGSYSASFEDGDTLSGSFSAPNCADADLGDDDAGTSACGA